MNKWTFAELAFDGWVHEEFISKDEAVAAGMRQFDDQVSFYVGRLEDTPKHQVVVDAEEIMVN